MVVDASVPIKLVLILSFLKGTSAYAGPHYQKLYGRVIHVWNNRKCQLNRSAMEEPQFGRRPLVIRRTSPSGKYALGRPCPPFTSRQHEHAYGAPSNHSLFQYRTFPMCACSPSQAGRPTAFVFILSPSNGITHPQPNPAKFEEIMRRRLPYSRNS